MSDLVAVSEKEIEEKVKFLSSAKCNHTQHMYIDITGDLVQGTLLSRIMYWFSVDKNKKSKVRIFKDDYFWIAKQRKDWWEEIRITERQYDKAIKELEKKGFVVLAKYKFNSMPTIHIRPDYENINSATKEWENQLRKEIVAEYKSELQNETDGNNTKCNSQWIDTKCKTGVTQESNLLTLVTNNDYSNINYIPETTKAETLSKDNDEADTISLKKSLPTSAKKKTKSELMELEADMCRRFVKIGSQYDVTDTALKNIVNSFARYSSTYTECTGKIHPILKDETLEKIFVTLATISDTKYGHFENVADYEPDRDGLSYLDKMVDEHFKSEHGGSTDWHISHFARPDYLEKMAQHIVEW